jgi:hypothetical protein
LTRSPPHFRSESKGALKLANTSHLLLDDSPETHDAESQASFVAKTAHLGAAREQRMRLLQDCAYRYLNHNVSNCQSYMNIYHGVLRIDGIRLHQRPRGRDVTHSAARRDAADYKVNQFDNGRGQMCCCRSISTEDERLENPLW